MSTLHSWIAPTFVLAALVAGLAPAVAEASSHREAPAISDDPAADNTDLYAWVNAGTHDKLNVVANWIPLEEPAGGPNFHNFSDDVRYEIYVARGKKNTPVVSYYIEFTNSKIKRVAVDDLGIGLGGGKEFFAQLSGVTQTYTVTKVDANGKQTVIAEGVASAPPNIGPSTDAIAYKNGGYSDKYAAGFIASTKDGGRVWAGPRDDGFYVDLGGVFDLANLRGKGTAQDGVSGFNTHSIALEIPTKVVAASGKIPASSSVDSIIGVWTATSRRKITIRNFAGGKRDYGPWVQVSRLGVPLINEVVIGLQDKDKYNATYPADDVKNFGAYVLNPILVRDAEAVGIYAALGVDPKPFRTGRGDILDILNLGSKDITFGDMLRIDLSKDPGFPNGRPIPGGKAANQEQADVTDVLMQVILSKGALPDKVQDGVDYNDRDFLAEMPWLPLPHVGYDGGHGTPTP
jgi:hypothetical protein